MKRFVAVSAMLFVPLALSLFHPTPARAAPAEQVAVCHVPAGKSEGRIVLVPAASVSRHLAHGDRLAGPGEVVGDACIARLPEVLLYSPANAVQLDFEDSLDGYNAFNNPTLETAGAVTILFSDSVDPDSVLETNPNDPQGTRNVRLFYFDLSQGPFEPNEPHVPGVNPPGANVLVTANAYLATTHVSNDTLLIEPTGFSAADPTPEGQYSVLLTPLVTNLYGDSFTQRDLCFFFLVESDQVGPAVIMTWPVPGQVGADPEAEIVITMSETILASTVNDGTISVTTGGVDVAGTWYTDGGNGPGNDFPNLQLDEEGVAGTTGTSVRNGFDMVFVPDGGSLPANSTITVEIATLGTTITDLAGNPIPAGAPNASFTFVTGP